MVGSMPRMVEDAAVLVDAVVLGVVDPAAIMDAVFEMFVGIVVSCDVGGTLWFGAVVVIGTTLCSWLRYCASVIGTMTPPMSSVAGAAPDANARKGHVWGEGYHLRGQ